jgi:hypothetical protein
MNPLNGPELTLEGAQAATNIMLPDDGLEMEHEVSVDKKNEPAIFTCVPIGPDAGSGKAFPGGLGNS